MKDQPLPPTASQPETLDSSPVIDLIESFRRSKAMFAAVSLGIFDNLEDAPAGAEAIAMALQASARAA